MTLRLTCLTLAAVALAGCGDGPADLENGNDNAGADGGLDTETEEVGVLLIDDCDDGDNENLLGGLWVSYDDYHDPGEGESEVWPTSWFKDGTFEMSEPGYGDTGYAARMTGTTATKLGYDYVGMIAAFGPSAFCPDPQPAPFEVAQYTGLRFMAKGTATGGNLTVKIIHTKDGEEDNCTDNGLTGDTLTNWVDYSANITSQLEEEWTEISVDFRRDFSGPGSVDIENVLEHAKSVHFLFQTSNGGEVDLSIDNLAFYTDESPDTDEDPDMVVRDPDPPEDEELASLEIDHPLQAVALESLDKGYNITNWLEQWDFDNFDTYNEEFIAHLVSAGFEALRLPIDLDRYIANRTDYFAGEAPLEIDPELFTILDAFDEWTLAAGISLTIDYHQYDQSFDIGDPLVTDAAIELWGAIAEHLADNTRPDLFFELLNEIEQAGGTNEVDQDEWRDLAVRIIDEIRLYDAERPILFGDVAWYSIDRLTGREPLDDDNIIYVFHFYDPFIFTHQGASWTDVSTARDIPYPYSPDRWPEHYADIGIDPAVQPSWIMDQVNSYYRNGNRSAMRNRIIEAKRWAVENNVPIICNEFGAYDGSSEKEDRVNYYTDLVGIFEELEIPWQHWFMIMDPADGTIDPDLAAAFGLK